MNTVPFYVLIEAAVAAPGRKHFTGHITDFARFTSPENLAKLEAAHAGAYAFMAFHPAADRAVASYIMGRTVSSDAGAKVLVLFIEQQTSVSHSTKAAALTAVDGVNTDVEEYPAYMFVRRFFPHEAPALPGVFLFNHFGKDVVGVFISLAGLDEAGVRQRLREVFSITTRVVQTEAGVFGGVLGAALAARGIAYVKNEERSPAEWFAQTWHLMREKKFELLAFVMSLGRKPA